MRFIKSFYLALVDVIKLNCHAPKLLVELFWCVVGILSLVLSIVLFPFIVARKYKELGNYKKVNRVTNWKQKRI